MKTAAAQAASLRMQWLICLALQHRGKVGRLLEKEVDGLTLAAFPVVLLF